MFFPSFWSHHFALSLSTKNGVTFTPLKKNLCHFGLLIYYLKFTWVLSITRLSLTHYLTKLKCITAQWYFTYNKFQWMKKKPPPHPQNNFSMLTNSNENETWQNPPKNKRKPLLNALCGQIFIYLSPKINSMVLRIYIYIYIYICMYVCIIIYITIMVTTPNSSMTIIWKHSVMIPYKAILVSEAFLIKEKMIYQVTPIQKTLMCIQKEESAYIIGHYSSWRL